MFSIFSGTFKYKKLEEKFSDYITVWHLSRIKYTLIFLCFLHLVAVVMEFYTIVDTVGWWILFKIRIISIALFVFTLVALSTKGITKTYSRLLYASLFISGFTPVVRFHAFADFTNLDAYALEIGMLSLLVGVILRGFFLFLPMIWLYGLTVLHSATFLYNTFLHRPDIIYDNLTILVGFVFFITLLLYVIHQYNMYSRKSFYDRELALGRLEKANNKLLGLHRLEKAFLAETTSQVLAHEIKNPLGVISSYAQILMQDKNLSEPHAKIVEKIFMASDRIDNVIKSIRSFSLGSIQRQKIGLKELVEQAESFWWRAQNEFEGRVDISIGKNVLVQVDILLVQGAIANIVRNGLEVKKGGKVEITSFIEDDMVFIVIKNDSVFSGDIQDVFDVYKGDVDKVTSTDKKQSTGIGLAFSRSVIEKHEGQILLQVYEDYTEFYIKIPYHTEESK